MNRLPTTEHDFDRSLRQLQQHAEGALSTDTLSRLRQARHQAVQATPSAWRRRGLWLATTCSAVLAVAFGLQLNRAPAPGPLPATQVAAGSDDTPDDTLLFEESPELYLWLGSDALAME